MTFAAVSPTPAQAATTPLWAAQEMLRSEMGTVPMAPGDSVEFIIGFKNIGQATWKSQGARFVSVYTYNPKYRNSVFKDQTWMSAEQPARLLDDEVKPGAIGRVKFILFAPMEPGLYHETFQLAAESTAWISGGQFTVDIEVNEKSSNPAAGFKALKMMVSEDQLSIKAGETKTFRVAFKNIGRKIWKNSGSLPLQMVAQAGNAWTFRGSNWIGDVAAPLKSDEILPGQLSFFDVNLKAPNNGGHYVASFSLAAGTSTIDGGAIDVPIDVIGFAPSPPNGSYGSGATQNFSSIYEPELSGAGPRGPNIRIGLFESAGAITLAAAGAYTLVNADDLPVITLSGVTSAVFDSATRKYTVTNGGYTYETDRHIHFKPVDPAATIFEITSYSNRPTWDPSVNFNRFRGEIDFHFIPGTGHLWVVEELPVEDYLRGLAETSNGSPYEYQKSLLTAARTYALYVKLIGGKHKDEYFDLDTSGNDQVYKGYSSELVRPQVVQAAEDTRGRVVTYNNELVVTPYFSRSDGRTRSWTEVWSSTAHPWLVSVPCPYDDGQSLWGHGVGMSANDAFGRAKNLGADWVNILKYYYTGTEVRQVY